MPLCVWGWAEGGPGRCLHPVAGEIFISLAARFLFRLRRVATETDGRPRFDVCLLSCLFPFVPRILSDGPLDLVDVLPTRPPRSSSASNDQATLSGSIVFLLGGGL